MLQPQPVLPSRPVVDTALARFRDRDHWRALNPQLSITDGGAAAPPVAVAAETLQRIRREIVEEGYFRLDDILDLDGVRALRTAADRLRAIKCPPVFLFVYDQTWELGARLGPVIRALLDGAYGQVPGLWVWHLDAQRESAGWPPHRDLGPQAVYPGGAPKIVTLWIPLSDATPDNGCIYMLPRHLDEPGFAPRDLQSVRALPARAGTVLGWAHDVLHWSGRASRRSADDRISLAVEFQRTDLDQPLLDGPPYTEALLDAGTPPPFARRLSIIGQQVLLYSTRYRMPEELLRLARRLVQLESGDDAARILADIDRWLANQVG